MAIVDEFPFPTQKPMAQELVRVMAGLYRTEREAIPFTEPFGVDPLTVTPGLGALNLWFELLHRLATHGTVRAAVQAARDQFPRNPRTPFLEALLADKTAPTAAEPFGEHSRRFDDTVSKPEALLFFDDLTMPVGRVSKLIATLDKMLNAAPAVCLLRVENTFGTFFGTGFRIGSNLVLTNHHVLFPQKQMATRVQADFGFDVDANGTTLPVTSLSGSPSTIRGESGDDWAVIEVPNMDPAWPVISVAETSAPVVGDLTYILQHPSGQQKRLGYVRNVISDVEQAVIRYLTDTQPGSSGSPVFDEAGHLIAIHHAGGRPMEVLGKPPVTKNEGIRISRILERLKENRIGW